MKKVFSGVILVLILISTLTLALNIEILSQASPETILYIDPSVIRVSVGNGFSINVTVKDVADLFAFDLFLGYNTTVLDALTVIVLPPFDRGPIIPPIINDPEGYVRVSGSLLPGEPGLSGSFPLATISFNATSFGNSSLHLYNTNLVDSMSNSIPHTSTDGSVTVYSGIITVPDDFSTIQEAINAALQGDTVYVKAGVYYEHVVVNKTLSLIGEGRGTTIIDGNGTGTVVLVEASRVTIRDFTIRGSGPYSPYTGILLVNSNYSKVEKNIIVNNAWGIRLENSSHTQIKFNNIADSTDMDGLYLYQSVNNSIVDNNITNNRYGIFLCESGNNTIINNNVISNRYWGIQIFGLEANCNLIANNTISSNGFTHPAGLDGLYIELSSSNEVVNNTLSMNARDGILLSRSSNNKIRSNKLLNNTCRAGILLSSWEGRNSTNNLMIENSLVGNEYGIYLDSSNDNFIYHNNFINNTRQVLCRYGSETNIWDDGYPSGGNYWSDYTGVDFYSGPYQNETGNDGIGDTPYVVHVSDQDMYPLVSPWPSIHEISLINITLSGSSPKINETITIYVTVQNSGHFTETFDVSVNYTLIFDPLIGTQTITLAPGETITLNFTWTPNATGRYEIKAYTNTIPDDIDLSDNTRITYLYVSATYSSSSSTEENPWTDIDLRGGRFHYRACPI